MGFYVLGTAQAGRAMEFYVLATAQAGRLRYGVYVLGTAQARRLRYGGFYELSTAQADAFIEAIGIEAGTSETHAL